jgi:hypothetical protein
MPTIPTVRAIAIPIVMPRIGGPAIVERRSGITMIPIVPLVPVFHPPALLPLVARFPFPITIAAPVPPVNPVAPIAPIAPVAPVIPVALVAPAVPIPLLIRHGTMSPAD